MWKSGQCHKNFDELVVDGNVRGWFQVGVPLEVVKLPLLQLLCDVRTR